MITSIMVMKPVSPPGFEGPPPRVFTKGQILNVPFDISAELAEKYIQGWIAVDASNCEASREGLKKYEAHARRVQAAYRALER